VEIQYYPNAVDFLAHAGKYLAQDEARYGLIIGLARVVEDNPHRYGPEDPWFCSVQDKDIICAVAMRTPPYKVIMAFFSGDLNLVAESLVAATAAKFPVIPGAMGDKELADIFAELWCDKLGAKVSYIQAQRIYRLVRVKAVPLSRGRIRQATEADKDLVTKWSHAFHIDTHGDVRNMPETDITPGLEREWVFLWEDGKPVSMALKTRPTDKGMTVGGVYTPPELRGKGYATSCVAELSRHILQSGKEFCTLYTDLANPTSNAIYKKIGYEEVGDSVEYTFEMPPEQTA
jgi:predicted GNAT family acetyltransferase